MSERDQAIATYGLKEKHAEFLRLFVDTGHVAHACELAGVSTRQGYWLLAMPAMQAALTLEMRRRLAHAAPLALRTLIKLAESAESERVRADCAKALIDRAGFVAPKAAAHDQGAELTLTEMSIDQLKDLAAKLEDEISGRAKPVNAPANTDKPSEPIDILD